MENKYQIALDFLISYPRVIEEQGGVSVEKLKEAYSTLQELIDKTTICGLSLDEAIPIIQMYEQLKYTTHQIEPIQDLMMGTKGQFYIDGESLNGLINEFDMLLDTNNQFEKENIKLEKALDKACKDCEAFDEGLAYETSCDNFKVDSWEVRKKRYLEESEK